MNSYINDAVMFMKITTVGQLMDVWPSQQEIPPSFSKVKAKFDQKATTYTLYELDMLRRRFCCEIKLTAIVFILIGVGLTNSVVAEWLVSTVLIPHITKSTKILDLEFFLQRHVTD